MPKKKLQHGYLGVITMLEWMGCVGRCGFGRCGLLHQHYAEAVGFFGGELGDAAEAGGFQVFFGDTTVNELVADVLGSLDA